MRIVVLGSTGMLGSAVGKYMIDRYGEDNVFTSYRNEEVSYGKNRFYFDAIESDIRNIPECDYIINCIGVIKPFMHDNLCKSIALNSVFPLKLAHYSPVMTKVIHITTDCVFSGKKGRYTEEDFHDAEDDYGKSKSLGEYCKDKCMVIRTSIIGEEIHKKASLVEWAKSQKGRSVNGFTNHLWNGITTKQYAKVVSKIIDEDLYSEGIYHVFSDVINKYQLLHILNHKFELNLYINKFEAPIPCDRSLSTVKYLNSKLDVPSIRTQIYEM